MISLTLKQSPSVPLEAGCITPNHIQGKTKKEIASLEVLEGNRKAALGDFFDIAGDSSDEAIQVLGDCSRVKWIGAGMTSGSVCFEGNAGMHTGSGMKGGKLQVRGNASDWLGAEMRGGVIHVLGNVGHLCGAAYRGASAGMRGGTILVEGNAGNETASLMRRGLVAIRGNVGDFVGMSMIAGTIIIGGEAGIRSGAEMKRGSIVFVNSKPRLLPTFRLSCEYNPGFLRLYWARFHSLGFSIPGIEKKNCWQKYCGDLVTLGLGEIIVSAAGS